MFKYAPRWAPIYNLTCVNVRPHCWVRQFITQTLAASFLTCMCVTLQIIYVLLVFMFMYYVWIGFSYRTAMFDYW